MGCSITERIRNRLWPSNNPNSLFTANDAPVAKIAECQDIFAERPVHAELNYIHDQFCETEHTRVTFAGTVVDAIAQEIKEAMPWDEYVPERNQHRDLYEYKMLLEHRKELPAPKVAGDAIDQVAEKIRDNMPRSYFTREPLSDRYIREVRDSLDRRRVPVTIPEVCIDVTSRRSLSGENLERHKRGADVSVEVGPCPECGYVWKASSYAEEAQCPSCSEYGVGANNSNTPVVEVKTDEDVIIDDAAGGNTTGVGVQ